MNKTIKLSIIFSLLFSATTYHNQAEANIETCAKNVASCTKNVIISAVAITVIYYIINAIATSPNSSKDPEIKNFKKGLKKFLNTVDRTAFRINYSLKTNLGININKYRQKIANVINDTSRALEAGFDDLVLTQEQKDRKFAYKLQQKFNAQDAFNNLAYSCEIL